MFTSTTARLVLLSTLSFSLGACEGISLKSTTDTAVTDTASTDTAVTDTSNTDTSTEACATVDGVGCYWMENESGNSCWIAAPEGAISFEECAALDACNGGGGESGGGCYKWSDGSDGERTSWACGHTEGEGCYWMENECGNSCWIAAPEGAISFEECAALDSCNGGGGESGGGCYKWADNSTQNGTPW